MDLKDFVKNTIVQIVEGASEAEEILRDKGASVNPVGGFRGDAQTGQWTEKDGAAQTVEFHVALTNSEKEGTSAGIGVLLGGIKLGANSQSEEQITSVTSIKFEIPVLLPSGKKLDRK